MDAASLSALVIASLGAAVQIWQLRVQHNLARQQAISNRAIELNKETFAAHKGALKEICTPLQKFQDELMLLVKSPPENFLDGDQRKRLVSARDEFFKAYQMQHTSLDDHERRVLLEVRNRCADVILMLDLEGAWNNGYLDLTEEQKQKLNHAASQLDGQHQKILYFSMLRLQEALGK